MKLIKIQSASGEDVVWAGPRSLQVRTELIDSVGADSTVVTSLTQMS